MGLMTAGGDGVSKGKLEAADAEVNDVVAPKKFYSKTKLIKTGTLPDKAAQTAPVSVGNDGGNLYARIPVGAYRTLAGTGYPEIKISNNDAIVNLPGGNRGAWTKSIDPDTSVTIPQGYHNGQGSVHAKSLPQWDKQFGVAQNHSDWSNFYGSQAKTFGEVSVIIQFRRPNKIYITFTVHSAIQWNDGTQTGHTYTTYDNEWTLPYV